MRYITDPACLWLAGRPWRRDGTAIQPPPPPPPPPPPNQPPVTAPDTADAFAQTPTIIVVLANDSDPEGGALTLVSAVAQTGTAAVQPDGTVLYTPPAGFTGIDTVDYVAADPMGATAPGVLTVTVAGPLLSVSPMSDGTLTVQAASGAISLVVTSPAEFAGTYVTDTALLAGGPVNIVPPAVLGEDVPGAVLAARPGLWIYGGDVTGESWAWRRNGTAISGATAPDYTVGANDAGTILTVAQTIAAAGGSRTAVSAAFAIPAVSPDQDAGLIAWYDAADAATIASSGSSVTSWASRTGVGTLAGVGGPQRGTRTINGLDVIDFSGTARMTGGLAIPASGDVALHAVIAIDAVASAFSAPISCRGTTRDFQLDSNDGTQFAGRMNVAGIGTGYALSGGPFSGLVLVSLVFDLTGTGTTQVFVNNVLRGTGPYTTALDAAQTLGLMTNRNQNAFFDGAVAEVAVTASIAARDSYTTYLSSKWGIT